MSGFRKGEKGEDFLIPHPVRNDRLKGRYDKGATNTGETCWGSFVWKALVGVIQDKRRAIDVTVQTWVDLPTIRPMVKGQPSTEFPLQPVSIPVNVNSYLLTNLLLIQG